MPERGNTGRSPEEKRMELFHGKTFDSNWDGRVVALGSSVESDSSPLPPPLDESTLGE